MVKNKISIQAVVNKILMDSAEILQLLEKGLVNANALARRIAKEVEAQVKEKVKLNTITVAIKRFQKRVAEGKITVPSYLVVEEVFTRMPVNIYIYERVPVALVYFSSLFSDKKYADELITFYAVANQVVVVFKPSVAKLVEKVKAPLVDYYQDAGWLSIVLKEKFAIEDVEKLAKLLKNSGEVYQFVISGRIVELGLPKQNIVKITAILG